MNADVIEKFEQECAALTARKNELQRQAAEIAAEIADKDTKLQEAETIRSMIESFIGSEPVGTVETAPPVVEPEVQEDSSSEESDEAEDDPDAVIYEDRVAVISIVYGEDFVVHWKVDDRELHFRRWNVDDENYHSFKREGRRDKYAILRAALRRAYEEEDHDVSFSHDEYALIEALASVDRWLTTGQLWKRAQLKGYSKSRTSVLNDLCDGKNALLKRYPETIMRVKDHSAVTWRML